MFPLRVQRTHRCLALGLRRTRPRLALSARRRRQSARVPRPSRRPCIAPVPPYSPAAVRSGGREATTSPVH
eukprot:7327702-Alexandrium_andersonii.AAC.1